jgi:hypothetical protein
VNTADRERLLCLLDRLSDALDGGRRLGDCTGRQSWPDRGVYLCLAPGETRKGTDRPRVTRVGTHAVSTGSATSLWDRLRAHRGTGARSDAHPYGGNHRGSVYRLRVGEALVRRHGLADRYPDWGRRSYDRDRRVVRDEEYPLERRVSAVLRDQRVLWLAVDDEPGPDSDRARVERALIAVLAGPDGETPDPRAPWWLGRHSASAAIRSSGLWNVDGVGASYDPTALDRVARAVEVAAG